jgi:hypothetical protein
LQFDGQPGGAPDKGGGSVQDEVNHDISLTANISSSDISTGQEPKAVLRTSLFNGLHPFVQYSSVHKWP